MATGTVHHRLFLQRGCGCERVRYFWVRSPAPRLTTRHKILPRKHCVNQQQYVFTCWRTAAQQRSTTGSPEGRTTIGCRSFQAQEERERLVAGRLAFALASPVGVSGQATLVGQQEEAGSGVWAPPRPRADCWGGGQSTDERYCENL